MDRTKYRSMSDGIYGPMWWSSFQPVWMMIKNLASSGWFFQSIHLSVYCMEFQELRTNSVVFRIACSDTIPRQHLPFSYIPTDLFILWPIYSRTMQRLASLTSSYLKMHRFEKESLVFQSEHRVSFESLVPIVSTMVTYSSNEITPGWQHLSSA